MNLDSGATYEAVYDEAHNGKQVYIFSEPCEIMIDRHEVNLQGIKFIGVAGNGVPLIAVIPESYDLLRPRVGEWHWHNWIFDDKEVDGESLELPTEYIEPTPPKEGEK